MKSVVIDGTTHFIDDEKLKDAMETVECLRYSEILQHEVCDDKEREAINILSDLVDKLYY